MQAVTYQKPYTIVVEKVPIPELIESTDVIVKVIVSGLCGSDLHVYRHHEERLDKGTIMGHEFVGVVDKKGLDVKNLDIGDRVLSPFTTNCGECFYCTRGITCRCDKGKLYGWIAKGEGIHGAQTEYVRVPLADSTLVKCPEKISNIEALLAGDVFSTGLFCAENGIGNLSAIEREQSVIVVLGCGPVGLMSIVSAIHLGAKNVLAVDSIGERLQLAKDYGAMTVINFLNEDVYEMIKGITDTRGADVVLEAVGNNKALELAFKILRPAGIISSVGVHSGKVFPFSPEDGYNKNVTYKSGRCPARHMITKTLPLLEAKKYNVEKIVSHRFKLCDAVHGYTIFEQHLEGYSIPSSSSTPSINDNNINFSNSRRSKKVKEIELFENKSLAKTKRKQPIECEENPQQLLTTKIV
ncbi:2679_t:CDS:2 [Ambispora gerdemannii]|uniref:2679_t:CDS:1 n=1 Tax=Ambispora gerdemannii TaxID=144530 RepID=A0A9N9A265_9GLOM|nr:2679_t:CDS:2 [Ambispora gerdemannii]